MGWTITGTDWAKTASWQLATILNEFRLAIAERGRSIATVIRGDTVGTASWIAALQTYVADMVAGFVQSGDATFPFTPYGAGYYAGGATPPVAWTWENICEAANLWSSGAYGFRRWVPVNDDDKGPADWTDISDPGWTFGTMQRGDILGPWIWLDLQRIINLLQQQVTGSSISYGFYDNGFLEAMGYKDDMATAQAAAVSDWTGGSPAWTYGRPFQFSASLYQSPPLNPGWSAVLIGEVGFPSIGFIILTVDATIEIYVKPTTPSDGVGPFVFDGNTTFSAADVFSLMKTISLAAPGGVFESDPIGSFSATPNWPTPPGTSGWILTDAFAVVSFTYAYHA